MPDSELFTIQHYPSDVDVDFDVAQLVRLMVEVEDVDQEGEMPTEETVYALLVRRKREWWVVRAKDNPGRLIGYTWMSQQTTERAVPYGAVHPAWRGQGIGTQLLERALARAKELGAAHVTSVAHAQNEAANAFFRQRGFEIAGSEWMMNAPAALMPATPKWPAGYTVQTYDTVQDPATLVNVCNQSRRDMWGHAENTPGALTEDDVSLLLGYWAPENLFLVFAPEGHAVGVCSIKPSESGPSLIDAPTLLPKYRKQGLHRPMVLTAMHKLKDQGANVIKMDSYGDPEETVNIYKELGFVLDTHYIAYRRNL